MDGVIQCTNTIYKAQTKDTMVLWWKMIWVAFARWLRIFVCTLRKVWKLLLDGPQQNSIDRTTSLIFPMVQSFQLGPFLVFGEIWVNATAFIYYQICLLISYAPARQICHTGGCQDTRSATAIRSSNVFTVLLVISTMSNWYGNSTI